MPNSRAVRGLAMRWRRPSTRTWPRSGSSTPVSILTSVDLPAPFSPTRPSTSPALMVMLTPRTARTPPKLLWMSTSSTMGGASAPGTAGPGAELASKSM